MAGVGGWGLEDFRGGNGGGSFLFEGNYRNLTDEGRSLEYYRAQGGRGGGRGWKYQIYVLVTQLQSSSPLRP